MSEKNFLQWMFDNNGKEEQSQQEEKSQQEEESLPEALGLTKLLAFFDDAAAQQTKEEAVQKEQNSQQEEESLPEALGLTKLLAFFDDAAAQQTTEKALGASVDAERYSDAMEVGVGAKTVKAQEIQPELSQLETEAGTETDSIIQSEMGGESFVGSLPNHDPVQPGKVKIDAWLKDVDSKQNERKALADRILAKLWLDNEAAKLTARRQSSSWLDEEIAMLTTRRIHSQRSSGLSSSGAGGMQAMANGKVLKDEHHDEWNSNKLICASPQGEGGHRRSTLKAATNSILATLRLNQMR